MPPNVVIVARAVVFAAATAWMIGGPFYRQVLRGDSDVFRPWVMFSGAGLTATEVRFAEQPADGDEIPLDRYAILAPERDPPKSLTHLKDEAAVRRVGKQLCRKLGAGADVRAWLRVAKRSGWKREMTGEENLCAG